jgi:hypothetical protein
LEVLRKFKLPFGAHSIGIIEKLAIYCFEVFEVEVSL